MMKDSDLITVSIHVLYKYDPSSPDKYYYRPMNMEWIMSIKMLWLQDVKFLNLWIIEINLFEMKVKMLIMKLWGTINYIYSQF